MEVPLPAMGDELQCIGYLGSLKNGEHGHAQSYGNGLFPDRK